MSAQLRAVVEHQSFLTPQEVSEILRVSVYTVRRWIKEGALPAYKVGRGWRISGLAIEEWLNQHQSAAVAGR
jgi:excisionase family DNA binding protein